MTPVYVTPCINSSMVPPSTMTIESGLPLPPMSPIWTNYTSIDTLSCAHNLCLDMEFADIQSTKTIDLPSAKPGLFLRLKVNPIPKLVLKFKVNRSYKSIRPSMKSNTIAYKNILKNNLICN